MENRNPEIKRKPRLFTEQATTGVRKLVQIYNMRASVSACVSVTNLCYNFPQGNLAMKPTHQDCKAPTKPKKHKKNKIARPMKPKKQDCKTHESSNLGTLGSDILFFFVFFVFLVFLVFLYFFVFLFFFGFSWFSLRGSTVSPQNAQKKSTLHQVSLQFGV